jgi:hypothetical protein
VRIKRSWAELAERDATREDVEALAEMGWVVRTLDGRAVLDTMSRPRLRGSHVYTHGDTQRRRRNKAARRSRKANR